MSQYLPEIFEGLAEDVAGGFEDAGGAGANFFRDTAGKADDAVGLLTDADQQVGKNAGSIISPDDLPDSATGAAVPGDDDLGGTNTPAGSPAAPGDGASGDGTLSGQAADNPQAAGRSQESLPEAGDPVDVATGDVVLDQQDVRLPGALPLVLERAHRSSYRAGRWFGRSWASTLDQRLEVTPDGVFFAAGDGAVLAYSHPGDDGQPVWPVAAARWPLARDGHGYTVTDPQAGITRRFEPRSGYYLSPDGYGELPLVSVTDRAGHQITVTHSPDGAPYSVTHDGGYQIKVAVNGGRVTGLSLAGAAGDGQDVLLFQYGYDDAGNLTEVVNSSVLPLRFSYDSVGRLTSWQDRNGWWYRYSYDDHGRCVTGEGPGGQLSGTFAYDPGNRVTRHTDAAGAVTVYQMTVGRRVAAVTDPLGNVTRSEYDHFGQLVAQVDPLGRVTRWTFDHTGNLTALTRPDGSQAAAVYNELSLPIAVTEPGGPRWLQVFDTAGNLTQLTGPDGAVTRYNYDERGNLASVADPLGAVTLVDSDPAGLPAAVTDPNGATTRYDRDGFGRLTAVTTPDGMVTRLVWTAEGELASRIFPDATAEHFSYDGEGNLVTHLDPAGAVTRFEYSYLDQVSARTGPDGTRTEFGYDHALRLTSVVRAGLTWRYEYDPAGRQLAQTDYNGAVTQYVYDAAGQVTGAVNGTGQAITYVYDLLGNMTEHHSGGVITTFAYDLAGRLAQAVNPDAVVTLERDDAGRVTAETCNGRSVRSDYDRGGRRTRRITPSDTETRWAYDTVGRPVALSCAGQELRFGYDEAGREIERQLPGGLTLTQEWDMAGQLAAQLLSARVTPRESAVPGVLPPQPVLPAPSQLVPSGGRTPAPGGMLQRRRYSYRADGVLTGIDDLLSGPRQLSLDPAGRVTGVTGLAWAESYGYDPAGNISNAVWPVAPGGPGRHAAGAGADAQGAREYSGTVITRAGDVRYEHDQVGRVILRQHVRLSRKPDTWHYEWDADDRLTGVTTPDGVRWHYLYDPLGRRIAKQRLDSDGEVTEHTSFTWDGPFVAEQATFSRQAPDQLLTWDYRPGSFTPLVQAEHWRHAPQGQIDQRFYAIVTDLIGSPAELVSPDGALAGHQQQTLWGSTYWHGVSTPLRFQGQYHDSETGLHYNNQRYYDPATGRYLTPDPLGLTPSPNPHAYVCNPTLRTDPLGLSPYKEVPVRIKAGQQAPGDYKLSPAELKFVKDLLDEKRNYQVFRTNSKASMGDFLVIDRSNPGSPVGWVVELKTSTGGGFPGEQLINASTLKAQFGLSQLKTVAGTSQQMLEELRIGRGSPYW
jgi:RHS repeat-associated protein